MRKSCFQIDSRGKGNNPEGAYAGISLQLPQLHGGVTEQVIDAQKLGECSCIGIRRLSGGHRISQSLVLARNEPAQKCLVERA